MNDFELIFTMLGEKVTTEITKKDDANELHECANAAMEGGTVAGNARKETEKKIGRSIVSDENYLTETERDKRERDKNKILIKRLK